MTGSSRTGHSVPRLHGRCLVQEHSAVLSSAGCTGRETRRSVCASVVERPTAGGGSALPPQSNLTGVLYPLRDPRIDRVLCRSRCWATAPCHRRCSWARHRGLGRRGGWRKHASTPWMPLRPISIASGSPTTLFARTTPPLTWLFMNPIQQVFRPAIHPPPLTWLSSESTKGGVPMSLPPTTMSSQLVPPPPPRTRKPPLIVVP